MAALARGQSTNCANPVLDIFTTVDGLLIDVEMLEFQIFDVSDEIKQANPVQIFPAVPGDREPVDTVTGCPVGGKLSTGHFVATWDIPVDASIGTHRIVWYFKLVGASPEQSFTEEFEILVVVGAETFGGYCLVADIRAEGVTEDDASDERLIQVIDAQSKFIDEATGWWFEPREMTFDLDGRGSSVLFLTMPIIAVSKLAELDAGGSEDEWSLDDFIIYNRHIRQNLTTPDDRHNPKIVLREGGIFPEDYQNVRVEGIFGYTEYDGSANGRTPRLIKQVCKKLVIRNLGLLADAEEEGTGGDWRVKQWKTRDQSITLMSGAELGKMGLFTGFTGDPEIDQILAAFSRVGGIDTV